MYPNPLIKQNVKNTVKRQIKCFFLMCYIKWKKGRSTSISTSLVIKRWKTNVSFNKILKMRKNDGRSILRMMPLRSIFLKNKYILVQYIHCWKKCFSKLLFASLWVSTYPSLQEATVKIQNKMFFLNGPVLSPTQL